VLILLSPAKTLDYQSAMPSVTSAAPRFLSQTEQLVRRMKRFDAKGLAELMSISPALAELNVGRFHDYVLKIASKRARPALFAFAGDVYDGLQAYRLTSAQLAQAQRQVRILSGLYGVLRPLDSIQPYRLEMGTKIDTGVPGYLYGYWRQQVTASLNEELAHEDQPCVINLASMEYFGAVDEAHLKARVITPVFEDYSSGEYKVISFFAKKARGTMCRYVLERRISNPVALKRFDVDGYRFARAVSSPTRWVFRRDQKESK
jgi:cytoplasmic iron level regulating protein YaaA (DUF328/UPF0246 family)